MSPAQRHDSFFRPLLDDPRRFDAFLHERLPPEPAALLTTEGFRRAVARGPLLGGPDRQLVSITTAVAIRFTGMAPGRGIAQARTPSCQGPAWMPMTVSKALAKIGTRSVERRRKSWPRAMLRALSSALSRAMARGRRDGARGWWACRRYGPSASRICRNRRARPGRPESSGRDRRARRRSGGRRCLPVRRVMRGAGKLCLPGLRGYGKAGAARRFPASHSRHGTMRPITGTRAGDGGGEGVRDPGAGDGIRTHDFNLGKVALYP